LLPAFAAKGAARVREQGWAGGPAGGSLLRTRRLLSSCWENRLEDFVVLEGGPPHHHKLEKLLKEEGLLS